MVQIYTLIAWLVWLTYTQNNVCHFLFLIGAWFYVKRVFRLYCSQYGFRIIISVLLAYILGGITIEKIIDNALKIKQWHSFE